MATTPTEQTSSSAAPAGVDTWWQTFLNSRAELQAQISWHSDQSYCADAVTHGAALFPLHHYGLIRVEGPEAASFLQGQLTVDIDSLNTGDASLGAHCDPKGRMHASFYIYQQREDSFLLFMPLAVIATALPALNKYAVFSKAELTDISASQAIFGLTTDQTANGHQLDNITAIHCHFEIDPGVRIVVCEREQAQNCANALMDSQSLHWQGSAAWESLLIARGIGLVQAATVGEFIPQMLNYDFLEGISFTKGCYTGQEIIARMKYRGKVKRRCVGFRSEAAHAPAPGSEIIDQQQSVVGLVVNAAAEHPPGVSPITKINGLAVLKSTDDSSDAALWLASTQPDSAAKITLKALPYAIPKDDA